MSRREGRDYDSKRRHSRFDREPSPKRSRRDGKQERERDRVIGSGNLGHGDRTDRDYKHPHRLHVASPHEARLVHDSKQEAWAMNKDSDKKPNDYNEASKHSSDPTEAPRSRSYFQVLNFLELHTIRISHLMDSKQWLSWGKLGEKPKNPKVTFCLTIKQKFMKNVVVLGKLVEALLGWQLVPDELERGWWKDSKDQLIEKAVISRSREHRNEKSQAKPDVNTSQRKDGLSERKYDVPPTTKKRPAFREKKIPVHLGDANPSSTETVKSNQTDHRLERNERREERSCNPRHLDGPEKQYAGDKTLNKSEARRDVFSFRGRSNSNYRGRDRFNGREAFHPGNTRIDKWKHDLYQEVNKDPIPKNEDDQIAKLEALLAS